MRIYLDHQAATPLRPDVAELMARLGVAEFGNPASLHEEGLRAREWVARAREQMAAFCGAESGESIILTGGGAEAVNLGVKGAALALRRHGRHIVLSAAEHPAVSQSVKWLENHGFQSTQVAVDRAGRIDLEAFSQAIGEGTILACVHQANHDVGTLQDIVKLGELAASRGVLFFVDAVASAGWMAMDLARWPVDLLAFSPHRFGGPKGVGVLYRRRGARLERLIDGGDQEGGLRAGTENVVALAGAGLAAERVAVEVPARQVAARSLQAQAWTSLRQRVPHLKLNGPEPGPGRHPSLLSLSVEFVEGEGLALMLDVRGVALAAGSACVTRSLRVPPVLAAIGLPESLARGTVLASVGPQNTGAEMDRFVEIFARAVEASREMSPTWEDFQRGLIPSVIEENG